MFGVTRPCGVGIKPEEIDQSGHFRGLADQQASSLFPNICRGSINLSGVHFPFLNMQWKDTT